MVFKEKLIFEALELAVASEAGGGCNRKAGYRSCLGLLRCEVEMVIDSRSCGEEKLL